jgi:hypothetical protein
MSGRIHVLAQQIFGKASVEECDLQEVEQLAQRYPYFAPAQFLLLEKLKGDPEAYAKQLQKSVLYYHNPLEFEYFISSDRFYTEENFNFELPVEEIHEENVRQDAPGLIAGISDEEHAIEVDHNTSYASEEVDYIAAQDELVHRPDNIEVQTNTELPDRISDDEKMEDEINEDEISEGDEHENSERLSVLPDGVFVDHKTEMATGKIDSLSAPNQEEPLSFEPYHTVDYFASQGIRLSQEEVPKDKFGKQLKSFTEWLKTMKRIPATEITQTADPSSESKVQHLAEDSVHATDVVTEAMAEVWLKQGNRQKALETYNKLSLQNPSKRAYFAALIENLNRS